MVGGVESYLLQLLPLLQIRGHDLACLCEQEGDRSRSAIYSGDHLWCIDELTRSGALECARKFAPDVTFVHAIGDLDLEEELVHISPSVIFVHNFRGICLSGDKTRRFPIVAPCNRQFGPGCLLQYFPRRCGGLNPLTMLKKYETESRRLKALHNYTKVICASSYIESRISSTWYRSRTIEPLRFARWRR